MLLLRITGRGAWDVKNNIRIPTAQVLITNESSVSQVTKVAVI